MSPDGKKTMSVGDKTFADAVEKHVLPLIPNGWKSTIPSDHKLYTDGPDKIDLVQYRRRTVFPQGENRRKPRLQSVEVGKRIAIYFSRQDLSAALVGYDHYGISGYVPQSAWALYTNILHHAANAEIASTVIQGQD